MNSEATSVYPNRDCTSLAQVFSCGPAGLSALLSGSRVLPCSMGVFDFMVTSDGCLDDRLARMAGNVKPNCGTVLALTLVLKATLLLLGGVQRQQRQWRPPFCIHNCTHYSKHCVTGLTRFGSHRAVRHQT